MLILGRRTVDIQNAIRAVYQSIESKYAPEFKWSNLGENRLWYELVACILGSRVSFEIANAAIQRLAEAGLLSEDRRSSCLFTYEKELEIALLDIRNQQQKERKPLRYPFHRLKAKQIRQSAEAIYGENRTLQQILEAESDIYHARQRLATEISGIGPKQASLFLRNIGYATELAVLDGHVLTYMNWIGLISETIKSFRTVKQYEEVEYLFLSHARDMGIPSAHFDVAIWIVMRVVKREGFTWH